MRCLALLRFLAGSCAIDGQLAVAVQPCVTHGCAGSYQEDIKEMVSCQSSVEQEE